MANSFIPQAYQQPSETPTTSQQQHPAAIDRVGRWLVKINQGIVVLLAFLVPIVFTPGLTATLGFDKVMVTMVAALAIVILTSLASLRYKRIRTVVPLPLLLFWGVAAAAITSAFLSGDVQDALRGSFIEPQSAAFIGLLALVMSVSLVLQRSKIMTLYALSAMAGGFGLVFLYSVIRFIFGPILPFGSFAQITSSPIGSFNDLAVIAGVSVIIGLITLLQLPLTKWMKGLVAGLMALSLLVLMVVNFFHLWLIVGFFALLFLIYILSRDTLFASSDGEDDSTVSPLLIVSTLIVVLVSVFFVVAGDYAGARMSAWTEVNYLEVRPSLSATTDVLRSTYQDDILLGSGPNRFSDMWRLYKDRSINETIFWNTEFVAGFGLVATWFVTLGVLGGVLLFAFHLTYLYTGFRTLLRAETNDSFWFYVATVSFTAAAVLWVITYIYVPGTTVLLITALMTGLSFVAYQALVPAAAYNVALATNRRRGLMLMGVAVVLIVVSVSTIFVIGKQYSAQRTFTVTAQTASSVEEFEQGVQTAYNLYPDERFILALTQLKTAQLQEMLVIAEPTEADQARFVSTAEQAILLAQQAIQSDPTSPAGYTALADVYNILDQAGLEGAGERTLANLTEAEHRDPLDPSYSLARAIISAQGGDNEAAREHIKAALSLKNNYTNALFLLTQMAIQEGNVADAISVTEQVVTLEPNNPTRYYQLGILYAANQQFDRAISAYQAAIARDPNYANARYMLALVYAQQGRSEDALRELRIVQESNPDNEQLRANISELESTGTLANVNLGLETPVTETEVTGTESETGVTASSTPATDLVTPVNTPPATENTETAGTDTTESTE